MDTVRGNKNDFLKKIYFTKVNLNEKFYFTLPIFSVRANNLLYFT